MSTKELFVSPYGNDKWSGRLPEPNAEKTDGPFATLEGAKAKVRELKKTGQLGERLTVYMRGGRYFLEEPVVFDYEDTAPVTFAAYPDETPIIDGGRQISDWEIGEINGKKCWVSYIPEVAQGQWYFHQLFVNGNRRPRTRLPKQGSYRIADVESIDFEKGMTDNFIGGSDTFKVSPGDIKNWHNLTDVDIVALHYWIEERMPIKSYDPETNTIVSTRRSMFILRDDTAKRYAEYYVENVLEALTDPGEWYLDRSSGMLYYIPMPDETFENTEIFAPRLTQFIKMIGEPKENKYVEFITIKGITFEHGEWVQPSGGGERFGRSGIDFASSPQAALQIPGVIYMEGVRNCSIIDCTIGHIGWYGIELSQGCFANRIIGNRIYDMGAGGVKLDGGDAKTPEYCRNGNNIVTDNYIHTGGRIFHSACGILSTHSFGNTLSHNLIHDLYYTGISCGWIWGYDDNVSKDNKIEKNHIYDLGHGLISDMGGIYTLGVQPGTVIRGNLIHDIVKKNYGGWAIYPDEGSSHILIEKNICYNTSSQCFHQHYGRENIVRNNIFAFGEEGLVAHSRAEDHKAFTIERNILLSDGQAIFSGGYSGQLEKKNFTSDLNLIWDISGGEILSGDGRHTADAKWYFAKVYNWEDWQELGQDRHSIVADPKFKDIEKYDFTLCDDSPAFKIGFEPIDISDVGPRKEFN